MLMVMMMMMITVMIVIMILQSHQHILGFLSRRRVVELVMTSDGAITMAAASECLCVS